jgi:hypothetical protein
VLSALASRGAEMDSLYELSAFAARSGINAKDMHSAMYTGYLRWCVFQDLQTADLELIPDLVNIVFGYLF